MTSMANTGSFPLDPTTATGLFRFEIGDVVGTPNVPDNGEADYEFMSDETIEALILAYPDYSTAKSKALFSMASQLIAAAQDIQVDDIKIKTVERANLMFALSNSLANGTALADAALGFSVVPLTIASGYFARVPQGIAGYNYGESGF